MAILDKLKDFHISELLKKNTLMEKCKENNYIISKDNKITTVFKCHTTDQIANITNITIYIKANVII
jgi:hypothetical protein